jgi:RHS repeat-associated protein
VLDLQDLTLPSSLEPVVIRRTFHSTDDEWLVAGSLGNQSTPYVPVPFGADSSQTGRDRSINWWHNWFAFVWPEATRWQVRLPDGELVTFTPCTPVGGQTTCVASPTDDALESRARLLWDTTGVFTYFAVTNRQYVFSAQLNSGTATRYFLSAVRDRNLQRTLATVAYGVPTGCTQGTPGMQPGTGVPFISSITSAEGSKVFFEYGNRYPTARGTSLPQCVLKRLLVGRAAPGTLAVQYWYRDNPPSYDDFAGLIEGVSFYLQPQRDSNGNVLPSFQKVVYPTTSDLSLRLHYGNSASFPHHHLAALKHDVTVDRKHVNAAYTSVGGSLIPHAEVAFTSPIVPVACPPNTSCVAGSANLVGYNRANRYSGLGLGQQHTEGASATQVLTANAPSRRTTGLSSATTGGYGVDNSNASTTWEFGVTANGPFNAKIASTRSDTVMAASAVPGTQHIAVSSVEVGRNTGAGAAVERTNYAYTYVGSPVTQQLVALEERDSVVPSQPSAKARKHHLYDTNGRLKGVIREGYTRHANGNPQSATWSDVQRFVGTFYRQPDSLGRPTEVQGPCFVANATVDACSGTFPVTRFGYYATGTNELHQLATVKRYPTGTAGLALVTTYSNYDTLGNAQTVVDENGVSTAYTFEANRPKTMTVNGNTWTYTYDRGHLTRVVRPNGDNDVICYRRLASTSAALSGGCNASENPSEEPTAMFRYANGASGGGWYEATLFTYGIDGELREEAVYQQGNTTTPFRRTTKERNPLGFTTFEKTGPVPNGIVEKTTRLFEADGLVKAQSTPYFAAPHFCQDSPPTGAISDLCAKFDYWNTGRLKQLTVKPLAGAADITVCLDYDAHGNVTGVKPGCATTGMHSYVFDDFGNVIVAKLANTDPAVPTRFEYDAQGNLVRKGVLNSSGSTTVLEWDFDQLGRPKESRENGTVVQSWAYDGESLPPLPNDCVGLVNTDNQAGRLTVATDSVWRTWYSYDTQGRVIREARVSLDAESAGKCTKPGPALGENQVLERTFTPNGNIDTLTYPSGRQVVHAYDSSGRLSAIGMTTHNGEGWSAWPTAMVENITWLPGGVLKSYDIVTSPTLGGGASAVTVSFRYGDSSDLATMAIPTTSCTWPAVPDGMGDSSGRLRAIYVTRSGADVLRVFYRWKGEQLAEQSRCYLAGGTPQWEKMHDSASSPDPDFQYDVAGRLGGASMASTYDATGGYGYKRVYRYDTRSNRTKTELYYSSGYDFVYDAGVSWAPDRLTKLANNDGTSSDPTLGYARDSSGNATVAVKSGRTKDSEYDGAGRTTAIRGATTSAGRPAVTFNFDNSGQQPTGTETVMRVATTQAGSFNYFYDAQNRRIRKQYPNGDIEGYFWGGGRELLMETSPRNIGDTPRTMDEYLWLAGRPVLSIRSLWAKGGTWVREKADWYTDCARRGEAGTCRPHAIITDVIGKPIATVDSDRKIAGVLEYDPYGHVNRVEHWGETAPHFNGSGQYACVWVAAWMRVGNGVLLSQGRVLAPRVDTARGGSSGCVSQWKSVGNGSAQVDPVGNNTCGNDTDYRPGWTALGSDYVHFMYCSQDNGANYNPQAFGVTVRGVEYRRTEQDGPHYIPPFRFPGQYYDAETELHENWNRYYDPSTGRYLSPEPMLQRPKWILAELRLGHQVPAYSYARNNPIVLTDPTGLVVPYCQRNPVECQRNADSLLYQECRCKRAGGSWTINFADPTPQDPLGELIIGGSCDIATAACGPNATGWSSNLMTDLDTWATSNPVLVCRQ